MQDDQVSFRQESVDNVFSTTGKPFIVLSPPRLVSYSLVFLSLMIFVFASTIFIKLPVKINATGEIIAGKDYHQIIINDDDKVVQEISVEPGEKVDKNQVLLQLATRDKRFLQSTINEKELLIARQQSLLATSQAHIDQRFENLETIKTQQTKLVQQLTIDLNDENKVLERYKASVSKGLISAITVDQQKRVVAQLRSQLLKENTVLTSINSTKIDLNTEYQRQTKQYLSDIKQLTLEIQRLQSGLQVLSPCDCIVDNILVESGLPIVAGQSVLTLSNQRSNTSLLLYIPASQYREMRANSILRVNVSSYPSSKYGALEAKVVSVSPSPVPGNMLNKKGQGLQNITYFVVTAIISNIPPNISLTTGMSVDSDVVVDNVSLFDLLFSLDD